MVVISNPCRALGVGEGTVPRVKWKEPGSIHLQVMMALGCPISDSYTNGTYALYMHGAKTRAKSIGVMLVLVLAPMVAWTASANQNGGNTGTSGSNGNNLNMSWLDSLNAEQVDYSAELNLYGSDLEVRLSSTEIYPSSYRQMFDIDANGVVDWNDSNMVNELVNHNMEVNLSDLPEVKLDGMIVDRLIGEWCNFENIVPYEHQGSTVNASDISVNLRCEFTLLAENFNSTTGVVEISSVGDEQALPGHIHASSWHGLNLTSLVNNLPNGTMTDLNSSGDNYFWLWTDNGLEGQFVIEFDVDLDEYDVCQEMNGYSFDEAMALASNLSTTTTVATIVMIDDLAEFELVSEILDHNATWVGATQNLDSTNNGTEPAGGWTNLDGTLLNSSLWSYGEPNNWGGERNGGEDLVELWPWSGFNDIDEHAYLPVLIEYTDVNGDKSYELFGGWYDVSCNDQDDWWDWQDMEWRDYSLWLDMVGDQLEVSISAHESMEIEELLLYGDLDANGELSDIELEVLESAAANLSAAEELPDMSVEGEPLNQLDHFGCEIWMPNNVMADGTVDEFVDMAYASLECKWVYLQQVAYDDVLNLTVAVNEFDVENESGWLSLGLGWGATQKGYVITDAYDTDEAVTEVYLEMYHEDYWGGQHYGNFGTIVMELEKLNEETNDSDWDDGEMVDYIAHSEVVGDEVAVELVRVQLLDATDFASFDGDGDGIVSEAEILAVEQFAASEMNLSELPPIHVNDVLLDNLEEWGCEVIMLGDEMDAMNLFEVAELECWFYFVDAFEFDDEILIEVAVEEYDYDYEEWGMVFAELGEDAAQSGWVIEDVWDSHAQNSSVFFHMVDDYLWEADHNGNHGTYNIKLLKPIIEGPVDEIEDLPPQCEVAWALSSEMMDMTGQTQAVEPSGSLDVTLGAGMYELYVYCADPNGDLVDVIVTISGVEVGSFSASEASGYIEFEVPEDADENIVIEVLWTSTDYSGAANINITADGGQGGLVIGNVVPGFSGVLGALALVGAVALSGRRLRQGE